MNRPIIFVTLFYIKGIILGFFILEKKFFYFILLFGLILIFLIYIFKKKEFSLLILILYLFLGIISYYYKNLYYPVNHIKNLKVIENIESFDCVIKQIPLFKEDKTFFNAEIKRIYTKDKIYENTKGLVKITVENKFNIKYYYGELLNIHAKLKSPFTPKNEGEFDYKKYLQRQKIFFVVFTDDTKIIKKGKYIDNYFIYLAGIIKEKFVNTIYSSLPLKEAKILEGIMLGNRWVIPDDVNENFIRTGTAHILAVSGMNVGLIALFAFLFFKILRIPEKLSASLIIIFIWIFAFITGFDASIVRASIMASFVLLGLILEFETDIINSLFASAFLILLFNPSDLFDTGFQLSYLATFGIIYFYDFIKDLNININDYIKEILFSTITAQIFLVPVMINTFHQISLISILANFFIVPLSSLIVILGFVMWVFDFIFYKISIIFGASIFLLIKLMLYFTDIFAKFPFSSIFVKKLPDFFIFLYFIFFLLLPHRDIDFYIKEVSIKKITGVFLILFFIFFIFQGENKFKFYALKIKGINAIFINTQENKKILILGYEKTNQNSGVKYIILPFLKNKGINILDYVIFYSIKDEYTILNILNNFIVKKLILDLETSSIVTKIKNYEIAGNINEVIDRETKIFIYSNKTEIIYKSNRIYFEKILTEDKKNSIIYCCFFKDEILEKVSKDNKCILNTENIYKFTMKKIFNDENIFDLAKTGMILFNF